MNEKDSDLKQVYAQLSLGFRASEGQESEERWQWLTAAHIVGQYDLRLHWHSHVQMLAFATQRRDVSEMAGQMLRLALVPVGHLLGRLPAGNIGRATVNAFSPMAIDERSKELISAARRAALSI